MSQMENLSKHQEDIAKETDRMMAVVNGSESGQKMMESSSAMAGSNEMQSLMQVISSPDVSEQDQFNMGQYMGQFLQANPDEDYKIVKIDFMKTTLSSTNYRGVIQSRYLVDSQVCDGNEFSTKYQKIKEL